MKTIEFYSCKGLPNQRNYCLERCKSSVQGGKRHHLKHQDLKFLDLSVFKSSKSRQKEHRTDAHRDSFDVWEILFRSQKTMFLKRSTEILSAISKIFLPKPVPKTKNHRQLTTKSFQNQRFLKIRRM